jgi:uncharacterized protein YjbI with pentapeptide repeats
MVNERNLDLLKQGVDVWNKWREENPEKRLLFNLIDLRGADLTNKDLSGVDFHMIDLSGVDLRGANLSGANLNKADLKDANLIGANLNKADLRDANLLDVDLTGIDLNESKLDGAMLQRANLSRANLSGAYLIGANLYKADLSEANLCKAALWTAILGEAKLCNANLVGANLVRADLTEADFTGADLTGAKLGGAWLRRANFRSAKLIQTSLVNSQLSDTNFEKAILTDCLVYGISAWGLKNLEEATQSNLIVTPDGEPTITVDDLEVAQFIYLLLNNRKIRNVIDTVTSKVVLILGRFSDKQKPVLNVIGDELRKRGYVPVIFYFEKPGSHTFMETVSTLAHMARFVIADFTDAKIVLEEVPHIMRSVAVPVVPLLEKGSGREPITLYNLRVNHRSLLDTHWYEDINDLLGSFDEKVIVPAQAKAEELLRRKAEELLKSKEGG